MVAILMTDLDEKLLTFSKAGEGARGDLDSDVLDAAGVAGDRLAELSFLASVPGWTDSGLASLVNRDVQTRAMHQAIEDGDAAVAASILGITEQELDASQLTVATRLHRRLEADGTLTTILAAGRPNTGKSNTVFLLCHDLAREIWPDLLVVSNSPTWEGDDVTVNSMHDLMTVLVDNRDRPKAVVFDEASRYMDSRTFGQEVAHQWTPAIKMFSKLGVEIAAHIGHTGKDVVPAIKRLTNLAVFKTAPDEARFFERWPGDADRPDDPLFDADLTDLEPTATGYDPDDVASWSWDLDADVYDGFRDWQHFGTRLKELGPTS